MLNIILLSSFCGLWKKTGVPGGNPRRHREKANSALQARTQSPEPFYCEAIVLAPVKKCLSLACGYSGCSALDSDKAHVIYSLCTNMVMVIAAFQSLLL